MRVQQHYAKYVTTGGDGPSVLQGRAADLGYRRGDVVPDALYHGKLFQASCGSGCPLQLPGGQPTADDRVIMDFGSGAGHDVLLLASKLMAESKKQNNSDKNEQSNTKKVIGVDVTAEMVAAAEENARQYPELAPMIEFMQSNFENPDTDFLSRFEGQVDLIVSNGVFNLCQDKQRAFKIAFRLLRPNGRLVFSDVMKLVKPVDINEHATIATSINGDVFSS